MGLLVKAVSRIVNSLAKNKSGCAPMTYATDDASAATQQEHIERDPSSLRQYLKATNGDDILVRLSR